MTRRGAVLLVAFIVALVFAGQRPVPAVAHALLVRADPPANAQVRDVPTVLTLYFSEALERKFSSARVLDQDNNRVDDHVEFDDADNAQMRVFLKPLSPGYITVDWENVSAVDGHRISGSYPLTILKADGSVPAGRPATAAASTSGTEAKPGRVVTKLILLLGGCALTGALAFLTLVTPLLPGAEGERAGREMERWGLRIAMVACGVLAVAGVAELLLQASNIGGSVADTLTTRWGDRWLLRNLVLIQPLVLILLSTLPFIHRRAAIAGALLGAVVYLAIVSSVSHSAAGGGAFWAASSDFVHLLAASVWIGMLAMLALLFVWARNGLGPGERFVVLATCLRRFSAVALLSVALLLFTGTVNSVIEVGRFADLLDTGYGRALLIKLLLLVPLLAIGAVNAYVLRADLVEAADPNVSVRNRQTMLEDLETSLRKTVRIELAVAIAVLAVVAVLVQLSPTRGRLSDPGQAGRFVQEKSSGGISATLVIDPNQPGINSFEVYLTGATDAVESVRLDFSQAKGGGEARLIMDATNPPTFYVGKGPYLTQPGDWRVAVDIRRSGSGNSDLLMPFDVKLRDPNASATSTSRSGGDFASPLVLSPGSLALLVLSLVLSVGLVAGSRSREDMPNGYVGAAVAAVYDRMTSTRFRSSWSLAALIVMAVVLSVIVGAHQHPRLSSQEAAKGNPIASSPESIARGGMLFSQNCVQCHGESGRGDGPLAPTLRIPPANLYDHVPYHPDEFFFSVISNGLSGVMPAFSGQISDNDRWNILNYLRDRFTQPPPSK